MASNRLARRCEGGVPRDDDDDGPATGRNGVAAPRTRCEGALPTNSMSDCYEATGSLCRDSHKVVDTWRAILNPLQQLAS